MADTSWDGITKIQKYGMWYIMISILAGSVILIIFGLGVPQEKYDQRNLLVLHPEWIKGVHIGKDNYVLIFGNDTTMDTGCPSHIYPFWNNSTHYKCSNGQLIKVI